MTGKKGQLASEFRKNSSNLQFEFIYVGRDEIDLLNQNAVFSLISEVKPEFIIHTAAKVGGINYNINQKYEMLSYNLTIDLNVINASLLSNVPNFLYFSSSCVYPITSPQPFEVKSFGFGDFEKSNENYAIAKATVTKLLTDLDCDLNKNYKTLMLSNLYGASDNFDEDRSHVLASAFRKVSTAKKLGHNYIEIWGDGNSRREFTLASDVAKFILKSLPYVKSFPSIMNLGSGVEYSITQIYKVICEVLDYKVELRYNLELPSGVKRKLMNSDLAKKEFKWDPETELQNGIKKELVDINFE